MKFACHLNATFVIFSLYSFFLFFDLLSHTFRPIYIANLRICLRSLKTCIGSFSYVWSACDFTSSSISCNKTSSRQRRNVCPFCKSQALSVQSITRKLCTDKCILQRWKSTSPEYELVGKADVSLHISWKFILPWDNESDEVLKWMATRILNFKTRVSFHVI